MPSLPGTSSALREVPGPDQQGCTGRSGALAGFPRPGGPRRSLRAHAAIERGYAFLAEMPFACRKADDANPFLRELVIPFGGAGYVALFEIEDERTVTILAVRHQREDDCY